MILLGWQYSAEQIIRRAYLLSIIQCCQIMQIYHWLAIDDIIYRPYLHDGCWRPIVFRP